MEQNTTENNPAPSGLQSSGNKKPFLIFLLFLIIFSGLLWFLSEKGNKYLNNVDIPIIDDKSKKEMEETEDLKPVKFTNEQEVKEYFSKNSGGYGYSGVMSQPRAVEDFSASNESAGPSINSSDLKVSTSVGSSSGGFSYGNTSPSYQSTTNVQVLGIDEADIVKNDGNNIFYSRDFYDYTVDNPVSPRLSMEQVYPETNYKYTRNIDIINAYPPKNLKKLNTIEESGNMYYFKDHLVVLKNNGVSGYLVSNPSMPVKKWDYNYKNSYLVESRLYGNELYLVLGNYYNYNKPCPIELYEYNGSVKSIACDNIYHPKTRISGNSIYTIVKIDPRNGDLNGELSFVGGDYGNYGTIIYMSPNNLYVSYSYSYPEIKIISEFINDYGYRLFPNDVMEKFKKINGYDITDNSKLNEYTYLFENYLLGLSDSDKDKFEEDTEKLMKEFAEKNTLSMVNTGLFKIGTDDFEISGYGYVPGRLLNQFSLDEFNGNLRAATTSENYIINAESSNNIFVLDKNLSIIGQTKDMGLTERIYSVRFIGNKGYVVTFRQVDPFYVLDLSDPRNPTVKGELKIPGYSSYLHPLKDNIILGVGMDNSKVKLSLFDVTNPTFPVEISKYELDEYTTDIFQTHRAFTQDPRTQAFFIPANNSGYVFSYKDNQLKLLKSVNEKDVNRSVILDNFLYILTNNKVVVLDESNWDRVNEITL